MRKQAKLAFFLVCRALGLFWLARRVTRRQLRILCYHGFELDDETRFRPQLFIGPEVFARRLDAIRRLGFTVLSLDEAVERLYSGRLPDNAVVITVDDGFHSVLRVAVPPLVRHGFPATVYVTSYYVKHPNPIFRLVVQYMFWKAPRRRINVEGAAWTEDRAIDLADPADAERAMWACIEHGERRGSEDVRQQICRHLGAALDVPYERVERSKMLHLMSPEELRELGAANVQVELHTHRHTFPATDRARAEQEIDDNRRALAEALGSPQVLRHFCYPSGLWDERQWPWLDGMGLASSTTCLPGLNDATTPRHALRRFLDGANIHQLEFEAALSGFKEALGRMVPRKARA